MSIQAEHPDPYTLNYAGLVAFNPVLPVIRRELGPAIEVEPPIMWPGPEIELHRADSRSLSGEDWIRIKLDFAGETHVLQGGREISDQRAADLLGVSERAFARSHALVESGMKASEIAMDPGVWETAAAPTAEERLASTRQRNVPPAAASNEISLHR